MYQLHIYNIAQHNIRYAGNPLMFKITTHKYTKLKVGRPHSSSIKSHHITYPPFQSVVNCHHPMATDKNYTHKGVWGPLLYNLVGIKGGLKCTQLHILQNSLVTSSTVSIHIQSNLFNINSMEPSKKVRTKRNVICVNNTWGYYYYSGLYLKRRILLCLY